MTTTTNAKQVKMNIMTQAQYDTITPSPTELYVLTDADVITVDSALSSSSTNPVQNKVINTALNSKQDSSTAVTHTASTAVGNSTTPVYINSSGVATALSFTIAKSVPSDAVFTDTTYSNFTGATSIAGGAAGLVPAPSSGDNDKILTGGATWSGLKTINNTSLLGSGNISVLQNSASGTDGLSIGNTSSSAFAATSVGYFTEVSGDLATAIGHSAKAYGNNSIQLGMGTNTTDNSFSVGFYSQGNYQLLDGTTGYIPSGRINAVKDQRSGSLKFWSGTKAQYDAITTKDSDTIYNVEDTTSPIISILDSLYPVGAIYIGTMNACPLATLGIGTWTLVSSGRVLQGASSGQTVGSNVAAGLPDITGEIAVRSAWSTGSASGAFYVTDNYYQNADTETGGSAWRGTYGFNASRSSSIYGNSSTVQPPAYLVNIWERTA